MRQCIIVVFSYLTNKEWPYWPLTLKKSPLHIAKYIHTFENTTCQLKYFLLDTNVVSMY